jgi:hypothetical protein
MAGGRPFFWGWWICCYLAGSSWCSLFRIVLNYTTQTKKLVIVGDILDIHCMEKYNTHWRKPASYFADYSWYKVCDITKRIYNKAHVEIRLGYKQSFGINFIDNTEAQKYVDDLINSSEKQFHVIVNI